MPTAWKDDDDDDDHFKGRDSSVWDRIGCDGCNALLSAYQLLPPFRACPLYREALFRKLPYLLLPETLTPIN
jgi:hypothetical protein